MSADPEEAPSELDFDDCASLESQEWKEHLEVKIDVLQEAFFNLQIAKLQIKGNVYVIVFVSKWQMSHADRNAPVALFFV